MTTGDKLWSDNGSRAELHIGSASLRIGSTTGFSFLNLTDDVAQVQLTEGTLRVRVKRLEQNETFEIDTPNLAFSILRPGTYRSGRKRSRRLDSGQCHRRRRRSYRRRPSLLRTRRPDCTVPRHRPARMPMCSLTANQDDFDRGAPDRDHREDRSASARYVSDDAIGYEDLDDYGGWRPVPDYGTVWFPHTTVVGWAPYRYGHWVYIAPWGYTWVEDEPWGFAPFHYGRWVTVGGVWGWVPCAPRPSSALRMCARFTRPRLWRGLADLTSPLASPLAALASVGWFPLGPREVYVPSLSCQPHLRHQRQRLQHDGDQSHRCEQLLQHRRRQQAGEQRDLRESARERRCHRDFHDDVRLWRARSRGIPFASISAKSCAAKPAYGGPAIAPTRQTVFGSGAPVRVRTAGALRQSHRGGQDRPTSGARDVRAAASRDPGKWWTTAGRLTDAPDPAPRTQNNARTAVRVAPPARTVTPVQPRNAASQPNGQPNNQPTANANSTTAMSSSRTIATFSSSKITT